LGEFLAIFFGKNSPERRKFDQSIEILGSKISIDQSGHTAGVTETHRICRIQFSHRKLRRSRRSTNVLNKYGRKSLGNQGIFVKSADTLGAANEIFFLNKTKCSHVR
jgi:hypothetical protein